MGNLKVNQTKGDVTMFENKRIVYCKEVVRFFSYAAFSVLLLACGGGGGDGEGSGGGPEVVYYQDADGDGYGNATVSVQAAAQPSGYVTDSSDCDDSNAKVYPGAPELADGLDNDCDGTVDESQATYYQDSDGDGYGNAAVWVQADTQPSGYVTDSRDCNDNVADINPSATEVFDFVDNNCDGVTDDVPPPAPVVSLGYQQVKKLHFSWADVAGETEYRLLENPDGTQGYSQVATINANEVSHDHEVFLPERVSARYLLRACNSYGCTDSNELSVDVTGMVDAIGYFKASNTDDGDRFGWSVALSSNGATLAVGALYEDSSVSGVDGDQTDDGATDAGAVYVFVKNAAGSWQQQAYIKAFNTDAYDEFGYALALSDDGNTLVVSAPGEDSVGTGINSGLQASNAASASGAVYVFRRNGGSWSQQAYIKASNTHQNYRFGESVDLSGDGSTLVVGSPGESSSSKGINGDQTYAAGYGWDSGAAYVFVRSGEDWSQQAYVKASNTDPYDKFGQSVGLSSDGNVLAVGAYYESSAAMGVDGDQADNLAQGSGAVYVFERNGANWSQQAYVKASNTEAYDWFGWSVALSGDGKTLAVGAPNEASVVPGINGIQSDNSVSGAGAAYVFYRDASGWVQQAYVKATTNVDWNESFGTSLSLDASGDLLAIGGPREYSAAAGINGDQADTSMTEAGAVYLYRRSQGQWSAESYLKASNPMMSRMFGQSVALSDDGRTLAAGATLESSAATGVSGAQNGAHLANSGAVYVY